MPNELSDVVVSIHVASSNPILPLIKVEEVIVEGAGTLTEAIFGGQVTQIVELSKGRSLKELTGGELVYLRGKENGSPFLFNGAFTTDAPKKPWQFKRVSGSTG